MAPFAQLPNPALQSSKAGSAWFQSIDIGTDGPTAHLPDNTTELCETLCQQARGRAAGQPVQCTRTECLMLFQKWLSAAVTNSSSNNSLITAARYCEVVTIWQKLQCSPG